MLSLKIEPLSPYIGAEVSGVDLSKPLDQETFGAILQAWHDHLVLFFRNQVLTPEQHKAFCRRFGPLDIDRFVIPLMPEHPEIIVVVKTEGEKINFGNSWHADVTFYQNPVKGSALYALEVPPLGGDTLFANMYAAYETLSPGMKAFLEPMRAVHTAVGNYDIGTINKRFTDKRTLQVRKDHEQEAQREQLHPVIRTHPETRRKSLFVNRAFTKRFENMTPEESKPLLDFLYAHQERPEFTCRFRWTKGAMALWDNRCAHHYANNDYHGHRRLMHRLTIQETAPISL
jgi:taurine dioxygenase